MRDREKAVPLVERLRGVPIDARLIVEDDYFSSSCYAVGSLTHEAAAEIERLREENVYLKEVYKEVYDDLLRYRKELFDGLGKAVAAEREACAEMVDHILKEGGGTWGDAIRTRGEP